MNGIKFNNHYLQVSKSIVNMMFYSPFIPCLFCVNIFVSNSFIITSFKINDNFQIKHISLQKKTIFSVTILDLS